jgi:Na+/melibiose symporter-like transporter
MNRLSLGTRIVLLGALWAAAFLVSLWALKAEHAALAGSVRVALALLPVAPFAAFLWCFIADIRTLDELERRIHLEALAIAFPLAMLMLMTLGLLELAIDLPREDWSYRHVWAYLPLFYFIGLVWSKRRYL